MFAALAAWTAKIRATASSKRGHILSCLILLMLALCPLPASGQEIEDCLDCHEDDELTKTADGEIVSLFIDLPVYEQSIHGEEGLTCIDCHADLDGVELPHDEELETVDCATCHDDVAEVYLASMHGSAVAEGDKLAPHCWDCHGVHDILATASADSRVTKFKIPFMCGKCHKEGTPVTRFHDIPQDSILTHYSLSIHGEGLFRRGLTVSAVCTDCHTGHSVLPHSDARSTIHRDNVAETCQACHGLIEQVHQKVIEGELWEKEPHKVPVCIECHEPHEARRVFYDEGMSDRECLACHANADLTATRQGETVSLHVAEDHLRDSDHRNVRCVQCHTGATPSLERACATVAIKVDCAICHAEVVETYQTSIHGQLLARGEPDAPDCRHCHGTHQIKDPQDPSSPTYVSNVADLCAECHRGGGLVEQRNEEAPRQVVENYNHSVHGLALSESGLIVSASCTDCHTAHHILPQDHRDSSVHHRNITTTCATCHQGIYETFQASIHFTGEPGEDAPLPMCDDCHTSHQISRTDAAGFMKEIVSTCGHCHEEVTKTYFDTFHGKVVKLGYTETAKCQNCHGDHDILPPDNPHSTLSRENIVATCGECHPGSHRQFAGYLTHATHHNRQKYPFIYWTWLLMTSLLVGTFVFFGVHTLLWLPRSFQAMRQGKKLHAESRGKMVMRFERLHRQLHILVIISFLGLALTGMTLKFSYLSWAQWLSHLLGGYQNASLIHRICALITFYYFGRHLMFLAARKRERGVSWKQFLTDRNGLLFNRNDLQEFSQTVKWFIGMGPRPAYGHWTYWEKFDYFAVFWGVGMIGLSGLMLWFPEFFTYFLPGWFINVATVIHSDEALLATGFIFTVHFFNTHFRPDRFPMDPVIFTGRVSVEEFKADRPREYEEMVASGELEKRLVDPLDPRMVKALRIFGFTALTVGLTLILLIIGAAIFGYR